MSKGLFPLPPMTPEERAALQQQLADDDAARAAEEVAADVAEDVATDVAEEVAEDVVENDVPVVVDEPLLEAVADASAAEAVAESAPSIDDQVRLIEAQSAATIAEIQAAAHADVTRVRGVAEVEDEMAPEPEPEPVVIEPDEAPKSTQHGRMRSFGEKWKQSRTR